MSKEQTTFLWGVFLTSFFLFLSIIISTKVQETLFIFVVDLLMMVISAAILIRKS